MEDDSDSDIEEFSSIVQPPLIKQLKTILAEYPDDGQIIKELIQNAEDAGASEVRILYDDRCINTQVDKKSRYRKFLQGPALCFYNNATFTELDWKGIRMIYSSVKEEDPLKVGRFGLGFKSVFHITDNPVVLSGDRILFMDPHRSPDQVCLTIKLSNLKKWKKLNIKDLLMALQGTFGVTEEILQTGWYDGTLFWFPLRSQASSLSDTLYDKHKVIDLFTAFQAEASDILIFLKQTTKIFLYTREDSSNVICMPFTVELVKNVDEVQRARISFLTKIRNLNKTIPLCSISSKYLLSICTKSYERGNIVGERTTDWMVINYYKGGNMSDELKSLIQDESLGYSPLAGLAAPIGQSLREFKGHVFCFLPLPQERTSMTGLPVHVNGYFALSQNRRHIKWPSADQVKMHLHRDKVLTWNEKLLTEVLPDVYDILIQEMIQHSVWNGNPDDYTECIYAAIPKANQVVDIWKTVLPQIYRRIISKPTLLTINKFGEKSWIDYADAYFTTFNQYHKLTPSVKNTVAKVLRMYNKKYVEVPLHVVKFFSQFGNSGTEITPRILSTILKDNSEYRSLSREEKFDLLEFLTVDGQYEILDSLELLPLNDGSFIAFVSRHRTHDRKLLCRKDEMELFPGLDNMFIHLDQQKQWFLEHIQTIADRGQFQVQYLNAATFRSLLEETIKNHLGQICPPKVGPFSTLRGDWIQKVWENIFSHGYNVNLFERIPLVPSLKQGSWSHVVEIELYPLSDFLIVKQMQNMPSLNETVYQCLELLSIKVLPSLPVWLQRSEIYQYVQFSTEKGLMNLMDMLYNTYEREKAIVTFNNLCAYQDRKDFVKHLADCVSWTQNSKNFVKCLKLFTESGSQEKRVSLQENSTIVRVDEFPVKFPQPYILGGNDECRLAHILGARELDTNNLVFETLQAMQNTENEHYSFSERQIFMYYFMQNMKYFESHTNIMNKAKCVRFLRSNLTLKISRPADLFDPSDHRLQSLFEKENKFPETNYFCTESDIITLKKLGLKTYSDVTAEDLFETARILDGWCKNGKERPSMHIKAKQFLEVLEEKSFLLDVIIQGISLAEKLRDMRCIIHIHTKCEGFCSALSWFQTQQALSKPSELCLLKYFRLVGSTMSLIESRNSKVVSVFRWNEDPPIDRIVQQLENITDIYESRLKPDLLPLINEIYHKLSTYENLKLLANVKFQSLTRKAFIWNGDGFSLLNEVLFHSRTNDIDLSPYLLKIPTELSYLNSFFYALGCKKEQNVDTLLEIQNKIRDKYNSDQYSSEETQKDLEIIISILKRFSQEKTQLVGQQHKILFPIRTKAGASMLVLKPGTECTYCEARPLQDINYDDSEEEIYYVHEDVSGKIAEDLGIMSVTRRLLSKTDEFEMEVVGQQEPLTRRLHNLVTDGYLDGFSVIKEIVQNADDAKANVVYFLYDERENEDARNNLLHEGLAECQGPALWAYNDAEFQEKDFLNVLKLNGATKEDNLEKIGKFGLGFCSVYNLTDVPSFISGSNFVMLDPHKSYLGKPGIRIDLKKKENLKILSHFVNQFKPFQNIFGCELSPSKDRIQFNGTLFRFPLRTPSQAQRSEISSKFYSKEECVKLLELTFRAAGNLLLFTQNIRKVTIFHLRSDCADPKEQTSLFSFSKECSEQQDSSTVCTTNVLTLAANLKECGDLRFKPMRILQKVSINLEANEDTPWLSPLLREHSGTKLNCSWILSWATGTDTSLQHEFVDAKWALPLCGVAVPYKEKGEQLWPIPLHDLPLGFYNVGHVFCFLPLPIPTSLPVHINGCFAITSDRRHLLTTTEDDKCTTSSQWNQALMKDALVNAYIYLLEGIRDSGVSLDYDYDMLWPTECSMPKIPLQTEFFKKLVSTNAKVFHHDGIWKCFRECIFLDPELRNDIEIGNIAFDVLSRFNKKPGKLVIDLPDKVKQCIEKVSQEVLNEGLITTEQFFIHIFLPNLKDPFWSENASKRDTLVQFALMIPIEKVSEALQNVECIPTEPHGTLKRPSELIDPTSDLSILYDGNDEVFPQGKETFRNSKTLDLLRKLGMLHHTLPHSLLLERCHSVQLQAFVCGKFALNRCTRIIKYLSNKAVRNELEQDQPTLNSLQQIEFLPVLQRPANWHFSWKAEENKPSIVSSNICSEKHEKGLIQLARPSMLYFNFREKLVCCSELIIDETRLECLSSISEPVLRMLGVKGFYMIDIPHETVGNQLLRISKEYNRDEKLKQQICKLTLEEIYKYFAECLKSSKNVESAELLNYLESFKHKQIIMIDNLMVMPVQVARDLNHNCSPELFQLSYLEWRKYEVFFKAIGIKEFFLPDEIAQILTKKKQVQKNDPLSEKDTDLVCNLLLTLEHSLKQANRQCTEMTLEIYAPDVECILQRAQDLCMDDKEVSTSSKMKLVHGKISNELAANIGIKTKRLKHLEENVVGIPWGQKEKLVTRIRSLLGAYPCDESVLKELMQNADDAGANEIHFIKDLRTHECHKLLSDDCKPLQGPALCVYNDKPFTEKDLQGIQSLGMGSKSSDPSKTGKYGVGFNAVYHLTDVPSFLTKGPDLEKGETLCIFDPMCKFVPTATDDNPGIKCNMQALRQCYPAVLKGYHETDDTFFKSNCGTMFRFPLRNKEMSEVSLISKEEISVERMNKILSESIPDIFESLLFLKHVSKIKVSDITSGTLKEEYAVEAIMSENDKQKRDEFFQYVDEAVKNQTNENFSFLQIYPQEVGYTMIVKDSDKNMKIFYVVQRIGFDDVSKIPSSISIATKEHLIGHLPLAGVAASLPKHESLTLETWKKQTHLTDYGLLHENQLRNSGRAFCFLPMPLQTRLPVHVNGNFMLDHESRRSLWKGDKGYSYDWNHALLKDTISHAYISCLSFMKTHIFKDAYEQKSLNIAKLDLFNSYFPTAIDINDDYWKALLKYVYQFISDSEIDIFPSFSLLTDGEEHHVELKWFPLKRSADKFPSFFDNLSSEEKNLIATLRAMGMKIIKSPWKVQHAISSAELKLNQICPDTVLSFLLSYQEGHDDCCKIQLDCLISRTNLMSTKNALDLINFLKTDQELYNNLQDLPLLITNDDFIRCFDHEKPVFLSKYCELLPKSRDVFVHKDLVNIFDTEDFIKSGLFKYLQIQDLAIYLPNSIDPLVFASGDEIEWKLDVPEAPNGMWVSMFWTMLHENSMAKNKNGKILFEQECFEQNLKLFDNWSLLPCKKGSIEDSNNIKRWLIPIRKRNTVLHYNRSVACTDFDRAIRKIRFRCIDTSMFKNFTDASAVMKRMVSSVEKPLHFLVCLEYHIDEMKKCDLSSDECNALLIYLTENLELLKNNSNGNWLQDTIRSLPIHVTYDGKHVSFSQTDSVLVLPDEMPQDGIAEWATATNHILLIQNNNLKDLHAFLGFSYEETIDIYCKKIAHSFLKLPEISRMRHLEFIRDRLFQLHGSYRGKQGLNKKQLILLEILKSVSFLKCTDGVYKRPKDLFCSKNKVFKVMCDETQFPPDCFSVSDWREFLVLLGLITELSDEHVLKFAEEIAHQGNVTEEKTHKKVRRLLKYFCKCEKKWSSNTLHKLSTIKFIPPGRANSMNLKIFKQPNDCEHLICFSGSISSDFEVLCWSTLDLLPSKLFPISNHTSKLAQMLGVYAAPPVEKVIKHCQNICDAQRAEYCESKPALINVVHFRTIMQTIYTFLSENRDKDPKMRQKLQNTPIIFIDEKNTLVKSTQVVIDVAEADTIEPYLYKAPSFFGQFRELFVFLGASREIQIIHYVKILTMIKNEVRDETLYAKELGFLVQAMSNMVKRLPCMNGKEVELDVEVLYFPNRKGKLCDAKLLIVSDNSYFENRLSSESDIDYFMGFENLRIDVKDVKQIILCLPKRLRPSLLTDVVEEEIDTSEMNEIQSSKARKIGMFLKSSDFIHGVLRLVKHAIKDKFSEQMEKKLIHDLQNVQIKEVTGLNTYLKLKGRRIETSKAKKKCFMAKVELENNAQYTIYFQNTGQPENSIDDLLEDEGDLLDFIHACTGGILHDETTFKLMYAIFRCFSSPQQIQVKLDEKKINQYNLTQLSPTATFPVPGTYVPREFHPFLEQGFSFFQEHEYQYLALEVEDPDIESDDEQHQGLNNPVFKYVHIIEPVRSEDANESEILRKYLVDTGNSEQGNTVVYGFQLYKFKRRKENKNRDVIPADTASVKSFPLDETCRKIKSILRNAWTLPEKERRSVIKRLWLKWHPDKNKGQEDYCQKVFNYINATILKLERGQPLDSYDGYNSGCTETDNFTNTRYETMSHRMRQRGSQYSREYDQYYEYFAQTHGRDQGNSYSSHGGATSFSVPLPTEAKRWMQQAKRDLLAAEAFFPSAESVAAFNWICYTCHQATEKALKAGGFAVDANSVPQKSHQLTLIAAQLSDNLRELAQQIQNCVGEHTRMRYPDSILNRRIPSESYTEGHATEMLQLTRRVHDLVNDQYLN